MPRRLLAVSLVAALAGCQNYNFNPVGRCVIQPGSAQVQLAGLATADILFVVDDSGSMAPEQASLAQNFKAFIDQLAQTQRDRAAIGLDPLEFHIAITTSSVFESWKASPTATCGTPTAGQCSVGSPRGGWTSSYSYACTPAGDPTKDQCVDSITSYLFLGCSTPGVATDRSPFPAGDFVAAAGNPRVLHFTKELDWATWGTGAVDPRLTALVQSFQQNINVGTCGSGMEQHLQAGRLAVQKAMRTGGLAQPSGVDPAEWPHAGAKLVVVWVGDEDDCSNPQHTLAFDPASATSSAPGEDVCIADERSAAPRQYPVQEFASFFTGLDRPFSAAFIYSAVNCRPDGNGNVVCDAGTCNCPCTPGTTGCHPEQCTGKSSGTRFHDLGQALRDRGAPTLEASVCDADWSKTLQGIAQLVKPVSGLVLPSQPAATQVMFVGIQSKDGKTTRQCTGPGADQDWNFIDCTTGAAAPAGTTTKCVGINHATGHCEANPGETYLAQFLGVVPPGGCHAASDCVTALGGNSADWTCQPVAGQSYGTCLCNVQ